LRTPYFVYVIYSKTVRKKYTGYTENVSIRLRQHNEGTLSRFTKNKGPWELIYTEEFINKADALKREKYLKTGAGRDFIKEKFGI